MVQETLKPCALCGDELPAEQFQIIEHLTAEEMAGYNLRETTLARADLDADGNYTFYFCRWRHLGMFEGETGPAV